MYVLINKSEIEINGTRIKFPCSIEVFTNGIPSIVETNELVIVNFRPYDEEEWKKVHELGTDMNRNIWAFNQAGDLVWQVAPCRPQAVGPFAYDGVFFQDGRLLCGNAGTCRDYELNPVDGSVKPYPDHPVRPW